MAPKSRGRLTLRDADPQSSPVIDTGYLTDPEDNDIAVLMDGVTMIREIAARPSLARLIGKELDDTANVVSIEAVRRNSLHYYHPVGACKMGPGTDPAAVVDPKGKVHGLDNLYVADASIMPVVAKGQYQPPHPHASRAHRRLPQLTGILAGLREYGCGADQSSTLSLKVQVPDSVPLVEPGPHPPPLLQ